MVNERVLIRDKWRRLRKAFKIIIFVLGIMLVLLVVFAFGFIINELNKKPAEIVIENPLKNIVFMYTNEKGGVNKSAVVEQGILEFNADYINYILVALGVGNLHKSLTGEHPYVEFILNGDVWNSELDNGVLKTQRGEIDNEDLRIIISKEEAVEAILSPNIEQFMKDSVIAGRTQIEMVAGKVELFNKGYLAMYKQITGKEYG